MISYDLLPEHMRDGARRYVEHHIRPGGFLQAMLADNLPRALACADEENAASVGRWQRWLVEECPPEAWGSVEKMESWLALRDSEDKA